MDERLERFKDEADAFSQCKAAGYTAHKFDFPADDNEFHWHDFDSLTFITAGELTIFDVDSGESRTCGAGTKLLGAKGWFIESRRLDLAPSLALQKILKR